MRLKGVNAAEDAKKGFPVAEGGAPGILEENFD